MSIQDIAKKILEQAQAEADKITKDSQASLAQLNKVQDQEVAEVKAQAKQATEQKVAEARRAILVPARLAAKKAILEAKQKILGSLYKEIKKEKKLSLADLDKLREQSEVKAAAVLFNTK